MTLLPSKPTVERGEGEADPRVIELNENDQVFSVLRSETARAILIELYRKPAVASELADRVDTSLQNAQYHLSNLNGADLVGVVDTRYSEKGREMKVYAPSGRPLTLIIGGNETTDACRRALDEFGRENGVQN